MLDDSGAVNQSGNKRHHVDPEHRYSSTRHELIAPKLSTAFTRRPRPSKRAE